MKRLLAQVAFTVALALTASGQSFDRLVQALLAGEGRTASGPEVSFARSTDPRFDTLTYLASDSRAGQATAITASKDQRILAALLSANGTCYTLLKTDLVDAALPNLARSTTDKGVVDHAEFALDSGRTVVVDDTDADGRIDAVQVLLDGGDIGMLQLAPDQHVVRFFLFDHVAAVYRVSADVQRVHGTLRASPVSVYSEQGWVELAPGRTPTAIEHLVDGKRSSTPLATSTDAVLLSAALHSEQVIAGVEARLARTWTIWAAQRDRVQRSGVIGYRFPLVVRLLQEH